MKVIEWRVDRAVMCQPAKLELSVYTGTKVQLLYSPLFVGEHNSVMKKCVSASVQANIKVLWQNGYMHRSEIPDIVVQFHGAPQKSIE